MNHTVAVVQGVIIDFDRANTSIQSISKDRTYALFSRYEIESYAFDAGNFIMLMKSPHDAIRLCLEHRAMLKQLTHQKHPKGLDARVSIGLGEFTGDMMTDNKQNTALRRSIRGFDEVSNRNGGLGVRTGDHDTDALLGTTLRLLDRVVSGWSSSQSAAIEYALQGMTQHQIADLLHITQPSVNNRLKLAHWNEIEHVIQVWEYLTMQKSEPEFIY